MRARWLKSARLYFPVKLTRSHNSRQSLALGEREHNAYGNIANSHSQIDRLSSAHDPEDNVSSTNWVVSRRYFRHRFPLPSYTFFTGTSSQRMEPEAAKIQTDAVPMHRFVSTLMNGVSVISPFLYDNLLTGTFSQIACKIASVLKSDTIATKTPRSVIFLKFK